MVSLKIIDVKAFMSNLLIQNIFDNFLVSEAEIYTFQQVHIDGKLNRDYYNNDELEVLGDRKYSLWSEIKPFVYSLVKGSKLPKAIKLVMLLSPSNTENVLKKSGLVFKPEEVNGLFLNIRYEKNVLFLTTGTSLKTFTLDKSLEYVWDSDLKLFLKHHEIPVEEI